jgi:hypothetical protein
VIGAAEFCKWSEFDHGISPLLEFRWPIGYAARCGIETETIETHCFQK